MLQFSYLCVLVFIIIFSIILIKIVQDRCPPKIKVYYSIVIALAVVRYSYLIFLYFSDKQRIVYGLKELAWTNYIFIPLLSLAALYIFFRNQKKNFDYNYIFIVILTAIYLFLSIHYKFNITINSIFGFLVYFNEESIPALVYLIIISSLSVITLINMDKPYGNKNGMRLLTMALMITIFEFILYLGGIKIFQYPLVGEILILGCSYMSINTFKK